MKKPFNKYFESNGPLNRFANLFFLFLITAVLARLFAVYHWQGSEARPEIEGIYADILIAVGFAGITTLIGIFGRWLFMLPLLIWWFLLSSNLELIAALNDTVDWYDFTFALDPVVFLGSIQKGGQFTWFILLFLIITLVTGFTLRKPFQLSRRHALGVALLTALSLALSWLQTTHTSNWMESNPVARTLTSWHRTSFESELISRNSPTLNGGTETGRLRKLQRPEGLQPNILLVVLEGIPGLYVPQVAEYMQMSSPISLKSLEGFAEDSLVIPNMVAHKRQTIRGLYAMLCGDYSKLETSTPKAYEYIEKGNMAPKCLPTYLGEAGYQTHYLQAAPLAVMSKDRFMPAAGFNTVLGTPYFKNKYVASFWGADDRAFFEGAAEYIHNLQESETPWFLTLLTVGTHHPYGAPLELVEEYGDAKLAAVAYLDKALTPFMKFLEEEGLYRDTLVIITSDESHGVSNTMLGNNWGLGLVRGPGIDPGAVSQMYGLLDWPDSILDYLNLSEQNLGFIGRSIFREYPSQRQLLFSSDRYYLAQGKNKIIGCTESFSACSEFTSENGELFSTGYKSKLLDETGPDHYGGLIRSLVQTADTSLFGPGNTVQQYSFIDGLKYTLDVGNRTLISGGQYLSLSTGQPAMLELDVQRLDDTANTGIKLELNIWNNENDQDAWKLLAEKKPPNPFFLKGNEHLSLQYTINPQVDIKRINFDLAATAFGGQANLKVNKYSLRFLNEKNQETPREPYKINRAPSSILAEGDSISFVKTSSHGWDLLGEGWGLPESWGTWSIEDSSWLNFSWGQSGKSNNPYCIQIDLKPYLSELHASIEIGLYLNAKSLGQWQYQFGKENRPLSVSVESDWFEQGDNEIRFDIDAPASPFELGTGDDTRRLGIALKNIRIFDNLERNCQASLLLNR